MSGTILSYLYYIHIVIQSLQNSYDIHTHYYPSFKNEETEALWNGVILTYAVWLSLEVGFGGEGGKRKGREFDLSLSSISHVSGLTC